MIGRYTRPEMAEIWSEQRKHGIMLEVELLAAEAMEARGEVPAGTTAACRAGAAPMLPDQLPLDRIETLERTLKHDVIAFLTAMSEVIGEPARHLHKGMTSSDVLDTTFAVQLAAAARLILAELDGLLDALQTRAREHASTLTMGRSHGMHAEPTTFGLKLALLWDALRRARVRFAAAADEAAVGKISGAVGTFAHLDPSVEAHVCASLGLRPAPVSSQIVPRDVHAAYFQALALLATTIEQLAVEVRHLQRTEVGEASEAFTAGQKGSSAMPHKKNPILSENLTGLARLVRGYAEAALDDVPLWHERDISHSSVERVIGPDATIAVHFMLVRARGLVSGLVVNAERMMRNLELTQGVFYAQRFMLALVERGLSREEAYALVQADAMLAASTERPLLSVVQQNPAILAHLSAETLSDLAEPGWYVRRAAQILDRVFAPRPSTMC